LQTTSTGSWTQQIDDAQSFILPSPEVAWDAQGDIPLTSTTSDIGDCTGVGQIIKWIVRFADGGHHRTPDSPVELHLAAAFENVLIVSWCLW
jgi:hypothetical protein